MKTRILNSIADLKNYFGLPEDGLLLEPDLDVVETECDLLQRKRRDAEVLSTLAANCPGSCLEIGTSYGHGTYKLATNLQPGHRVFTVNLLPEQYDSAATPLMTHLLSREEIGSYYRRFALKNIDQIYENTLNWKIPAHIQELGLVFVDGGHDAEVVYSDSLKTYERLSPGGFLLWHDFNPLLRKKFGWIDQVMRGVEQFLLDKGIEQEVVHLRNSWIGVLNKEGAPKSSSTWLVSPSQESRPVPDPSSTMRSRRFLLAYTAYSHERWQEEEEHCGRLRKLGYDVEGVCLTIPGPGHDCWGFPKLDSEYQLGNPDLIQLYETLEEKLRKKDVLILWTGAMLHPDFIKRLPTYNVYLCSDDPESSHLLSQPLAPHFDYAFTRNVACVESYRAWGCRKFGWMPPSVDEPLLDRSLQEDDILEDRGLDISLFCERVYGLSDRAQRVEHLVQAFPQAVVRGKGWPGGYVSRSEMRAIFRRTKIGWNLHNSSGPTNSRLMTLPAWGILQICDNPEHLDQVFQLDQEAIGFEDLNDCVEKTRYYLAHRDERLRIAVNGWKRVLRDYTEESVWRRLLSTIQPDYLAKRSEPTRALIEVSDRVPAKLSSDPGSTCLASLPVKLHLGCGVDHWEGYINIDRDPASRADHQLDMLEVDTIAQPGTVSEVVMIHSLNYLRLWEARALFNKLHRLLHPGGKLIIETVNVQALLAKIQANLERDFDEYLEGIRGFHAFGRDDLENETAYRPNMFSWTPWHLTQELESAGFTKTQVLPPKSHSHWRDMRVEAVKEAPVIDTEERHPAAGQQHRDPVAQPAMGAGIKSIPSPSPKRVLFVLDPKMGHTTVQLRGLLFREAFRENGWEVEYLDIHQTPEDRIIEKARSYQAVYLLKVTHLGLYRRLKEKTRSKIIFDLTDALWMPVHREHGWQDLEEILTICDALFSENEYICAYGKKFNASVYSIPVCTQPHRFDLIRRQLPPRQDEKLIIGWIGSTGTLQALGVIRIPLENLFRKYPQLELRIVGCNDSGLLPDFRQVRFTTLPHYDEDTMIREILAMDIGVFPPPMGLDDYRVRGALKGLLYMTAGIPAVCQKAGDSCKVIQDGVNGMLAETLQEWEQKLEQLILSPQLRKLMGQRARLSVRREHSLPFVFQELERALLDVIQSDQTYHSPEEANLTQDQTLSLCRRAEALLQTGNPQAALELLNQAKQGKHQILGLHYAQALCLQQLDRRREMKEAARAELRINPSHAQARNLLLGSSHSKAHTQELGPALTPPEGEERLLFQRLRLWEIQIRPVVQKISEQAIELLPEGGVLVDVGANVGIFSEVVLAQRNCRAFLFEPVPEYFEYCRQKFASRDSVTVENLALSEASGNLTLWQDQDNLGWNTLVGEKTSPCMQPTQVRSISFDEYAERQKLERIDLIKIDVEGAEYRVLKGMQRTLARLQEKPTILCEIGWGHKSHPNWPEEVAMFEWLFQNGYERFDYNVEETTDVVIRPLASSAGTRIGSEPQQPRITVGIPTRNRVQPLLDLIRSLEQQTYPHFDLLISDDGTLHDLPHVIRRAFPRLQFHYLRGPGKCLPANRQNILEQSRTELVLMVDDDHYLEKDCLEQLVRTMVSSDDIGIVCAIWPNAESQTIDYEKVKHLDEYRLDLAHLNQNSDFWWKTGWRAFSDYHCPAKVLQSQFAGGGCLLYRRTAIESAGGFPTDYSTVSFREDTDLSHRVFLSGHKVLLNPGAIAYHARVPEGGCRDIADVEELRKQDGKRFLAKLQGWRDAKTSLTRPTAAKNPIRVLTFFDEPGWAWWHRAHQVQKHLSPAIQMEILKIWTPFNHDDFDFILLFDHKLAELVAQVPPQKIILGCSCPRFLEEAVQLLEWKGYLAGVVNNHSMKQSSTGRGTFFLCPNGVDTQLFFPKDEPPGRFAACWIGNSTSIGNKGLDLIQEACRRARVPLRFVDAARRQGSSYTQEQLRDGFYHRASFFVCASEFEGTPNPALEALACGLPVISTRVGNLPEILVEGHNGFLVDRSVEGLVEGIEKLRAADLTTLAQNARHSVERGWTWRKQAKNYENMFRELATKTAGEREKHLHGRAAASRPGQALPTSFHCPSDPQARSVSSRREFRIAGEVDPSRDLTQVGEASEFASCVRDLFSKVRPSKIIETGTYLGTGTTAIIASALQQLAISEATFYTIEVNPDHHRQALHNLEQAGLTGHVLALNGLSLPRDRLPAREQIEERLADAIDVEGIFVDHPEAERAQLYFGETDFPTVADDLLGRCLRDFGDRPDFVLLDSAGHLGQVEFTYLLGRLKGECLIALDDIYHVKHHQSFRKIQSDPRFEVLVTSKEKFGFCIARFTPRVSTAKSVDQPRLLWIRTDSIGDNLLAASQLSWLRQKYRDWHFTVVCQEHISELYHGCPHVDEVFPFERERALASESYRNDLVHQLQSLKADLILNSVYSREPLTDFLALNSGGKERIGMVGDLCRISPTLKQEHDRHYSRLVASGAGWSSELSRSADFLTGVGIQAVPLKPEIWLTPEDEQFARDFFAQSGLRPAKTLALFAGAQVAVRHYENYGKALASICRERDYTVLALGGEKEAELNDRNLQSIGSRTINLSGKTTLRQSAALLKRCRLAVGAETGLAHLACAVGTPNVVLLGGGHFGRFMPYSALTSVACLPLECFGCDWVCRYSHPHCVRDISPEVIAEAARQSLDRPSDKPRIFVQKASHWKPEAGQPKWEWLPHLLERAKVHIVPVEVGLPSAAQAPLAPTEPAIHPQPRGNSNQSLALRLCEAGSARVAEGKPAEALSFFERALDTHPEVLGAHYARGVCLEQLCRYVEAEEALQSELQRQPSHGEAKRLLQQVGRAQEFICRKVAGSDCMNSSPYRVSAIVSSYKSAEFIRECLEDLENQTIAGQLEVVVVDAASPENEQEIVREFQRRYSNIQYIRTDKRIPVYAAWNLAIHAARGEYITPFSTNDRLRREAHEILARELDQNPEVMMVYGDTYLTRTPHQTFENHTCVQKFEWPEYSFETLLWNCSIGPHPMWRKNIHAEIGYFDERYLAIGDQEFFCRVGERYPMRHIPEFTGLFWIDPEALSQKGEIPYWETLEIHQKYQRRYLDRLRKWVRQNQDTQSLTRSQALFRNTFGYLPRTRWGHQALTQLESLEPATSPGFSLAGPSHPVVSGDHRQVPVQELYQRGLRLLRSGQAAEGLDQLDRAAAVEPTFPGLQHARALCLESMDQPASAEAAIREEIRRHPENEEARQFFHRLRKLQDERRAAPTLPQGNPNPLSPQPVSEPTTPPSRQQSHLLGFSFFQKGDWSNALACFDGVLSQDGDRRGINYNRAQCLVNLGNPKAAEQALKEELKLTPNHPDAKNLLEELQGLLARV